MASRERDEGREERSGATVPEAIKRVAGEFVDPKLELAFIEETWAEYKRSPSNVMLIGGITILAFVLVDLLSGRASSVVLETVALRVLVSAILVASALHIKRATTIFIGYYLLAVINQAAAGLLLIWVGYINELTFIHNVFHVLLATLVFYLFFNNRFSYILAAGILYPLAFIILTASISDVAGLNIVRFFLYFLLANGLGVTMLSALNRGRRGDYLRHLEERRLNLELNATVTQLREAQHEVKTLQGLLPICCNCKKIRDDDGLWNQVEAYISENSEASFSHGICPDCLKDLYPDYVDDSSG